MLELTIRPMNGNRPSQVYLNPQEISEVFGVGDKDCRVIMHNGNEYFLAESAKTVVRLAEGMLSQRRSRP